MDIILKKALYKVPLDNISMRRSLLAIFMLYAVLVLAYGVLGDSLLLADWALTMMLFNFLSPAAAAFALLTNAGTAVVWLAVVAALYLRRHRRAAMLLFIGLLIDMAVALVLKNVFARPRPPYEIAALGLEPQVGFSFPSGHAQRTALAATVLSASFPRWRLALIALTAAVALSRIALGAHWVLDVTVGVINGVLIGMLILRLPVNRIKKKLGLGTRRSR
jgi:membrane-associated phospholipid phosphatase